MTIQQQLAAALSRFSGGAPPPSLSLQPQSSSLPTSSFNQDLRRANTNSGEGYTSSPSQTLSSQLPMTTRSTPTPTATVNMGNEINLVSQLSKVGNQLGTYNPSTQTFTSTGGQSMSVAPQNVQSLPKALPPPNLMQYSIAERVMNAIPVAVEGVYQAGKGLYQAGYNLADTKVVSGLVKFGESIPSSKFGTAVYKAGYNLPDTKVGQALYRTGYAAPEVASQIYNANIMGVPGGEFSLKEGVQNVKTFYTTPVASPFAKGKYSSLIGEPVSIQEVVQRAPTFLPEKGRVGSEEFGKLIVPEGGLTSSVPTVNKGTIQYNNFGEPMGSSYIDVNIPKEQVVKVIGILGYGVTGAVQSVGLGLLGGGITTIKTAGKINVLLGSGKIIKAYPQVLTEGAKWFGGGSLSTVFSPGIQREAWATDETGAYKLGGPLGAPARAITSFLPTTIPQVAGFYGLSKLMKPGAITKYPVSTYFVGTGSAQYIKAETPEEKWMGGLTAGLGAAGMLSRASAKVETSFLDKPRQEVPSAKLLEQMDTSKLGRGRATLILKTSDGKIVMGKTKAGETISIGGKIEPGQTPKEAVLAELLQETGLTLKDIKNLKFEGKIINPEETFHVYTAELPKSFDSSKIKPGSDLKSIEYINPNKFKGVTGGTAANPTVIKGIRAYEAGIINWIQTGQSPTWLTLETTSGKFFLGTQSRYDISFSKSKVYLKEDSLLLAHGTPAPGKLNRFLPFKKVLEVKGDKTKRGKAEGLYLQPPSLPGKVAPFGAKTEAFLVKGKERYLTSRAKAGTFLYKLVNKIKVKEKVKDDIFYHGTTKEAASKIIKEGLQPFSVTGKTNYPLLMEGGALGKGEVFVSKSLKAAKKYGEEVLAIRLTDKQIAEAYKSGAFGGELGVKGGIDAKNIFELNNLPKSSKSSSMISSLVSKFVRKPGTFAKWGKPKPLGYVGLSYLELRKGSTSSESLGLRIGIKKPTIYSLESSPKNLKTTPKTLSGQESELIAPPGTFLKTMGMAGRKAIAGERVFVQKVEIIKDKVKADKINKLIEEAKLGNKEAVKQLKKETGIDYENKLNYEYVMPTEYLSRQFGGLTVSSIGPTLETPAYEKVLVEKSFNIVEYKPTVISEYKPVAVPEYKPTRESKPFLLPEYKPVAVPEYKPTTKGEYTPFISPEYPRPKGDYTPKPRSEYPLPKGDYTPKPTPEYPRPKGEYKPTPYHPPYVPAPTEKRIPHPKEKKKLILKAKAEPGYYVVTRKQKRDVLLTPKPLIKGEALSLGMKITGKTARATFRLVPTTKAATRINIKPVTEQELMQAGYRAPVRKGKLLSMTNTWVQKRPTRMSSQLEIKDIQKSKRSKNLW